MILRLKRGKAKPVWAGHPWIYSGAVESIEGKAAPAALAAVVDHRGALIGWGHVSPEAPIAVRMWSYAPPGADVNHPPPNIETILKERLQAARARRLALGLPSEDTNVYRLVNSEGDRLPGITVDVFDRDAVLMLGTPGAAALCDRLVPLVAEIAGVERVHTRISPEARRLESVALALTSADEEDVTGPPQPVVVREHGVRFVVEPGKGQKTGFYIDQREHRQRVAKLAHGKRLLDVCAFSGGFSLHALAAGAVQAVAVDTSPVAAALAQESARENRLDGFVFDRRDAFVVLTERAAAGERFDVVVLDPPKLARSRRELPGALQRYSKLNELALRCLADDGVLVTCSCSRHVSEDDLERAVADAALRCQLVLHRVHAGGLPACHPTPAGFVEGRYLKVLTFQISRRESF